ncbi:helicase HerA-like domain-containing protein [Streptomyces canus]
MPEAQSGSAALPREALKIASGYAFTGPALDLGALLWDGVCLPDAQVRIPLPMLNRHGLVAGATGTGKTKTLQLIAEQLSAQGVPVFLADIKGDVSGISAPGVRNEKVQARAAEVHQAWAATGCPAEFYALGVIGHGIPVRATVTSFGPVLLSKVLQLNQTQEQSLGLIFHSPLYGRYAQAVDRESAYEKLSSRGAKGPDEMKAPPTSRRKDPSVVEQVVDSGMFKSLARSLGTQIGREITRSLFGTARRRR